LFPCSKNKNITEGAVVEVRKGLLCTGGLLTDCGYMVLYVHSSDDESAAMPWPPVGHIHVYAHPAER